MQKKIVLVLSLYFICLSSFSQINGNGNITTKKRSLSLFSELVVDFPAEVTINCKSLAQLSITTDENIFEGIEIKHEGGKLIIHQEAWIEPTSIKIVIGVPFLKKLKTGGYGNFYVNKLEGANFILDNPVGTVRLAGHVDQLTVSMHKGNLDALELNAKNATLNITGRGKAKLHVSEYYEITYASQSKSQKLAEAQQLHISEKGISSGNDQNLREKISSTQKPQRINLKLHNNSSSLRELYIKGPASHRFSYGIAIAPFMKRKESFPVGTEIYLEKALGNELLYTVSSDDLGKSVKLFKKD